MSNIITRARKKPDRPSLAVRLGLDSGVHRLLETPLVINGAEGSTVLRFLGSQAAAAGWPEYGGEGTLALQAGTAPTYGVASPYLGALDGGVKGNAGGYFSDVPKAMGAITTEDIVCEMVAVTPTVGAPRKVASRNLANNTGWWSYFDNSVAAPMFGIANSGGTNLRQVLCLTPTALSLVHALFVLDRSAYGIGYTQAGAGSALDIYAAAGSLAADTAMILLAGGVAGDNPFDSVVLYYALHYRASGWLDTHLQPTLAAQRFALLTASRPAFSVVPSTYPSSAGSTSPVYQTRRLSDGTDRLHYMGAGSPTFDRIVDAAGRAVVAHLVEVAAVGMSKDNRAHNGWLLSGTCTRTEGQLAPDGTLTAVRCAFSTDSDINSLSLDGGVALASAKHAVSVWGKRVSGGTSINLGSTNSLSWTGATQTTIPVGAAWSRLGYVATYGAAYAGSSANVVIGTYDHGAGGGTLDAITLDVWCSNVELGDYQSSEMQIATAAVTRAASVCKYSATACFPRAEGTVIGAILCRSFTPGRARVLFSVSDGSTANEVQIFTTATTGLLSASSRKAAGTSGDVELTASGSVFTNAIIPVMVAWRQNQLDLWARISGVWVRAQDLTIDAVAGATLTTFAAGSDGAGANQCGPGAYWLAGWQSFPQFISDPSAVRSGVDSLWSSL